MFPRLLALALLAWCVLLPRTARADPALWVAHVSRLHVEGGPTLLRHEVDAVCGDDGRLSCRMEVRWTLPASDDLRQAVVYLAQAEVHQVLIDGQPTEHLVDGPAVRLALPPSAESFVFTVEATVALRPGGPRCAFGMSWPLAEQRHIMQKTALVQLDFDAVLSTGEGDPPPVAFDGDIEYALDTPRKWRVGSERSERIGDRRVSRGTSPDRQVLAVDRVVMHGAVIGAGLRMQGTNERPWLRGGWEVSAIPMMVHTLAVESDLRRISVVPSTEVGTAGWLFIPSLSAGVGVPLRVFPEVRPGARVFGGLNFPVVSIIGGYDALPQMRGRPTEHIGHVGLQFSL